MGRGTGEQLSPMVFNFCLMGICMTFSLMFLGLLGVLILIDESGRHQGTPERFSWLSETQFGGFWKHITEKNPFITTICVNGGLVGSVFLAKMLVGHRKAVQAERRKIESAAVKKTK